MRDIPEIANRAVLTRLGVPERHVIRYAKQLRAWCSMPAYYDAPEIAPEDAALDCQISAFEAPAIAAVLELTDFDGVIPLGVLCDGRTDVEIRPATAAEWLESMACSQHAPHTGAILARGLSDDLRAAYVYAESSL